MKENQRNLGESHFGPFFMVSEAGGAWGVGAVSERCVSPAQLLGKTDLSGSVSNPARCPNLLHKLLLI
jgi:hypothetical protein